MAIESYLGHKTAITWNGNAIGNLTAIGGLSLSTDSIDVTTLDGVNYFRKFIQGLTDAGSIPLSGYFKPSDTNGQQALLVDQNARVEREVVITLPDSIATFTFNAFLLRWGIGQITSDGAIPWEAELKITDNVVLGINESAGLTTPYFAVSESGVVTPAAAGDEYKYIVSFLTGVESFTVTPTAEVGVITVNGNVVKSGAASSSIALGDAGSVTEVIIKVVETGKVPVTYKLLCVRAGAA